MKAKNHLPPTKDAPYMQGVMPALLRAVKRAHKVAHRTGTKIVIMQDGKVVEVPPDPELYNDPKYASGLNDGEIQGA